MRSSCCGLDCDGVIDAVELIPIRRIIVTECPFSAVDLTWLESMGWEDTDKFGSSSAATVL